MSKLEIKRIDSPLARDRTAATETPAAEPPATPAQAPRGHGSRSRPRTELTSVPTAPGPGSHDPVRFHGLAEPTALHEPLELLSSRIPSSLRRNLSDLTAALRGRGDGRQTQKALPEQEVLALLVWLAGSPEDPDAVARLSQALDAYRAGRYAAAAHELGHR